MSADDRQDDVDTQQDAGVICDREGPIPPQPRYETSEYAAMMERMVRAYARRVASGDIDDLAAMIALGRAFDEAIGEAVRGARETYGRSWAEIAEAAGTTRQAAQQRWGQR